MGTVNANFLPATTGLSLGSSIQQWLLNGSIPTSFAPISVNFSSTPIFTGTTPISVFSITLTADVTSSTLVMTVPQAFLVFQITQDGTGGHKFTWPTNFPQASAPDSAPNQTSTLFFYFDGTTAWQVTDQLTSGVVFADQFPGSDASVKIKNAIAALPALGGIVDCRALTGTQTSSVNPFSALGSTQSIYVLLGNTTFNISSSGGTWTIPAGGQRSVYLKGMNVERGTGAQQGPTGTVLNNISASADTLVLSPNIDGVTIEGIYFQATGTGKHINMSAGNSGIIDQIYIQGNQFQGGAYGIYATTTGASGTIFEVTVRDNIFNQQSTTGIYLNAFTDGFISQWTIENTRIMLFGVSGIDTTNSGNNKIDNCQITGQSSSVNGINIVSAGIVNDTITNTLVENMTGGSATAIRLTGSTYTIYGNDFFRNTNVIDATISQSMIGCNNANKDTAGVGFMITLRSPSAGVIVMEQQSDYPSGFVNEWSGWAVNYLFQTGLFYAGDIVTQAARLTNGTPTGTGTNLSLGNTTGFGNGAAGTAVTTTLKSTGSGPATPQTVVKYWEIDIGGTKYWVPLVQ